MKFPTAGDLRQQVTIEYAAKTQDPTYGTDDVVWTSLAGRLWAEVQDVLPSRSESVQQGLTVARNQTRLRMRWRDDIDSTMRVIVHGDTDKTMQIVAGPAELGARKQWLEMMLEELTT